MTTIKINPNELTFSPWNVNSVSPENMEKLKESVRRNGIFRPVVVREVDGAYEVIAGEHTTRVARELGYEVIDVYNLGPISEIQAKEISIIDNQHFGVEDQFGLSSLLREIQDAEQINPADFLPFSERELTSIFKATEINLETLDMPDDEPFNSAMDIDTTDVAPRVPVEHQIMRFKVPIRDAEFVQRTIEAIINHQGLKSTDSLASAGDALVWLCNSNKE